MLIGIEGGLGDGKTVLCTKYLLNDSLKGYTIFSNYNLFDINYNNLIVEEMLENEQRNVSLRNCTLGVDEITVFADCRVSGSIMNRLFSYFVLQSRKRSVDVYYTTQDFDMIDKRINRHTHIKIIAESIYDNNDKIIKHYKKYTIIDLRNKYRPRIERFILDIRPYYDYYDTDEIIKPPMLKNKPKRNVN